MNDDIGAIVGFLLYTLLVLSVGIWLGVDSQTDTSVSHKILVEKGTESTILLQENFN